MPFTHCFNRWIKAIFLSKESDADTFWVNIALGEVSIKRAMGGRVIVGCGIVVAVFDILSSRTLEKQSWETLGSSLFYWGWTQSYWHPRFSTWDPIKVIPISTNTQTHIIYAIFDQNKEKSMCFNHFCVYAATCTVFKYCSEILMIWISYLKDTAATWRCSQCTFFWLNMKFYSSIY